MNDLSSVIVDPLFFNQVRNPQNRPMDGENLHKRELIRREQSGMYSPYREMVRRFELPPGYYVIIPSTFRPDEEAEFILRLYTEKEVDSEYVSLCILIYIIWASRRENLSSEGYLEHRCRPACVSTPSDQPLCFSFL